MIPIQIGSRWKLQRIRQSQILLAFLLALAPVTFITPCRTHG